MIFSVFLSIALNFVLLLSLVPTQGFSLSSADNTIIPNKSVDSTISETIERKLSKMEVGRRKSIKLPEKIIVGYANWNQCDETLVRAVEQGVNVLIWFSVNLAVDSTGVPVVAGGPDMNCVATIVHQIREAGLETIHLISIGGWNSPHPDTSNSAVDVYNAWNKWNTETIINPDKGFYGFDGFDWDIEGNDTPTSPYNHFTVECLNLMGEMSQLAKKEGHYLVAMAPAESYLDPTRNGFDRSLLHEYEEWKGIIPPFPYHGRNCYAYLLSKFGVTTMSDGNSTDTFDFITVQLYEGYSHAEYNTTILKQVPNEVVVRFVQLITKGWEVAFSEDAELEYSNQFVKIPPQRLVVGLANGWAGDGKFLLIYPDEVAMAYSQLASMSLQPRGFGFWDIADEGKESQQQPGVPVWLASGLNEFMHIRPVAPLQTSNPSSKN
jgi:chitinase